MEQSVQEKVKRFVELSREFTVEEKEVFGDVKVTNSLFMGYMHNSISINHYDLQIQPSRLEVFEKQLNEKAEKARRFEEYITLQNDLGAYFRSLDKLNS